MIALHIEMKKCCRKDYQLLVGRGNSSLPVVWKCYKAIKPALLHGTEHMPPCMLLTLGFNPI